MVVVKYFLHIIVVEEQSAEGSVEKSKGGLGTLYWKPTKTRLVERGEVQEDKISDQAKAPLLAGRRTQDIRFMLALRTRQNTKG